MSVEQEIRDAISTVLEEGEIKHLAVDAEEALVTAIIETSALDAGTEKSLKRAIAKVVKLDLGYKGLKLAVTQAAEKGSKPEPKTQYITITSGKGGVGKSTVAGNLAVSFARLGLKVGLLDADIYGPSLPRVFNIKDKPQLQINKEQKILPVMTKDGVALMSTEFLTQDDTPLMWRGPMLSRMLTHLFDDILWEDELDYIIVDLPPGTGDVALDIKNFIPSAKTIVVTTPNKMASHIAIKSGLMAQQLGHEILGVVENMSYFINPVDGTEEKIFGSGGAAAVAESLKTDVLAEIPIAQVKEEAGGSGIFAIHEENGIAYLGLANKIMKKNVSR